MQEKILILDFGSQYTQLIARRVRELNVYCEIHPYNRIPTLDAGVKGVILSGSPYSVRDEQAPHPELGAIKGRLPLLGVCYGAQWLAQNYGGQVEPAASREYGRAMLNVTDREDALLKGMPERTQVWMSHGDTITLLPAGYRVTASTDDVHNAAFRIEGEPTWGIQFHPEVYHSTDGLKLLENFVAGICGCRRDWSPESFVDATVRGCDLLVCEANHDEDWVRSGPYPYHLKARILGDRGHLSNEAGAELAALAVESGTRQVALAHLSAENNTPSRARQTVCRRLSAMGCDPERDIALWVAPRNEMGPVCQLNREEAVLC